VSHEYLVAALRAAGLSPWLIDFVRSLYVANGATLVVAGSRHAGFALQAGIRQGCPLSPILFAVAMDVLLRRLGRVAPDARTRAFADDVGAMAPDLFWDVRTFGAQFADFGRISGLVFHLRPRGFAGDAEPVGSAAGGVGESTGQLLGALLGVCHGTGARPPRL